MPFVTPLQIEAKTESAFGKFLRAWFEGRELDFFPHRLRVCLEIDVTDPSSVIKASERLMEQSKERRGWGYSVHREQINKRGFGSNPIPRAITIDSREDLLRLAKRQSEFEKTSLVVEQIRNRLPKLESWLDSNLNQLTAIAEYIDGLIQVTEYFIQNPLPDCFARQLPLPVDTKFIFRNKTILRKWFDLLLPLSSMDPNESKFERRFGLRDGRPHRAFRLLDSQLLNELGVPFDEMSLPLTLIAKLPVRNVTVFIVENDLNLLTLPEFPRGIAVRGEGNALNRLDIVRWLETNRIIYWGDVDVEGLVILSRMRNIYPHTESIMMDRQTLEANEVFQVDGNGSQPICPTNLTIQESEAFHYCLSKDVRLEQEKIPQHYVVTAINTLFAESPISRG